MNISILVFGKNNFIATLPDQIRYATAFSVEVKEKVCCIVPINACYKLKLLDVIGLLPRTIYLMSHI